MFEPKGIGLSLLMLLVVEITALPAAATPVTEPVFPWLVSVSAGPVWASGGSDQTFYLQPTIEKTYTAGKTSNAIADGEIFLGIQRVLNDRLDGQLGLAIAATSNANLTGNIWDDANVKFNNFRYTYNIQHTYVALKGKLLGNLNSFVKPYVSGSLGVGFNRARGYSSTPLIFEALPMPNFSANTSTTFSYTVGIGLQRDITINWLVGIGYEFSDWGQSQLARAPGQTLGNGLSLNHFYINGLMFNLTYLS